MVKETKEMREKGFRKKVMKCNVCNKKTTILSCNKHRLRTICKKCDDWTWHKLL